MRKNVLLFLILAMVDTTAPSSAQFISNDSFATGDLTGWSHSAFMDNAAGALFATDVPFGITPGWSVFTTARADGVVNADSNGVVAIQTDNFDGNGPTSNTAISPFAGTHLAFITNSGADAATNGNTLAGSFIAQSFLVPTDALILTLDARQLSNEGLDTGTDTIGNTVGVDFGGLALEGTSSLQQFLFDEQSTSAANFHVANYSSDNSVGFGGFVSGTDWQTLTFDLIGLRGQSVTLTAFEVNTGNSAIESRLLLDNIVLQTSSPATTPEPGALSLFVVSLATGAGIFLSRRRREK